MRAIDPVIRIDHYQKLCKNMKPFAADEKNEGLKEMRMPLLAQNEAGRIVDRSFTSSESNHQSESLLRNKLQEHIAASAKRNDQSIIVLCDNATAVRAIAHRVLGDDVVVKQD